MGGDGILPFILKHAAVAFLEPIHYLFTLCLSRLYLPEEWCSHCITPNYKSGRQVCCFYNYRPVSLLCCTSKVLERIFFDKVFDSVVTSSISDKQFDFVRNRSTLQQLLLYSEFLYNVYDDRQRVDSIYLDIQKAIDTIPHTKLLSKLWDTGITGNLHVYGLFKAYLSGRKQCVATDNHLSEWPPVSSIQFFSFF